MSLNEICSRIKHMNMQVLSEYLDYLEIEKGLAENTRQVLKSTHMSETCMKRSFHPQVL